MVMVSVAPRLIYQKGERTCVPSASRPSGLRRSTGTIYGNHSEAMGESGEFYRGRSDADTSFLLGWRYRQERQKVR